MENLGYRYLKENVQLIENFNKKNVHEKIHREVLLRSVLPHPNSIEKPGLVKFYVKNYNVVRVIEERVFIVCSFNVCFFNVFN